ncbi:hypothetical protein LDENG_00007240 [Lucifuga dentata]|nr:hypothetical protein LDENG_00007240 [Lucifuga dentata]
MGKFEHRSSMKKKLLIDVDTGVDAAQAIMVLADPNVEILGITCCFGNTPLENVLKNTLRLLKIPVTGWATSWTLRAWSCCRRNAPRSSRIIRENPEQVSLVAMAPLTKLTLAVKLKPNIGKTLKALYIIGGNTELRCNTLVSGGFNFVADPEAAYIVLDRFMCPTFVTPCELSCNNSLPWSLCEPWLCQNTEKASFMKSITRLSMEKAQAAEDREIIAGNGDHVTVELEGKFTCGLMVLDFLLNRKQKVFVMKMVEQQKLKKMLTASLQ